MEERPNVGFCKNFTTIRRESHATDRKTLPTTHRRWHPSRRRVQRPLAGQEAQICNKNSIDFQTDYKNQRQRQVAQTNSRRVAPLIFFDSFTAKTFCLCSISALAVKHILSCNALAGTTLCKIYPRKTIKFFPRIFIHT